MTRAEMVAVLDKVLADAVTEHDFPSLSRQLRKMKATLERQLESAARGGRARAQSLSSRRLAAIARKGARAVPRGENGRFRKGGTSLGVKQKN